MTSLALQSYAHRPSRFGDSLLIILAWAFVSAALLMQQLPLLAVAGPPDPDSQMRLVEVRDFLAGVPWTDMLQPRAAPPDGILMHWSRLIDWPLASLIRLAQPEMGREQAELFAIAIWPLALYLVFFFGITSVARRLLGAQGVFPALVFAIFAGPAMGMFMPGHITHHNAQIALVSVLLALALRCDRSETMGVLAGCVASIMLSIGLESLPLVGVIAGGVALAWAFSPARLQPGARGFGLFFASGMIVQRAFAAAPQDWLSTQCDIASYPYVAVAVVGGLGLAALAQQDSHRLLVRLGGLGALGLLAVGIVAFINPTCLKGPYAEVDARLWPLWLDHVSEARNIAKVAHDSLAQLVAYYLAPVLAMVPTALALKQADRSDRWAWATVLACLVTAFCVTMWELRGGTFASILVVPGLAWAVMRVRVWTTGKSALVTAASLLAIYALPNQYLHIILPDIVAKITGVPGHAPTSPTGPLDGPTLASTDPVSSAVAQECSSRPHFAALAAQTQGIVLVGSNLGPAVLLHTRHSAVSAPFHRNTGGILDGFAAFGGSTAEAYDIIQRRRANYVIVCTRDDEMKMIAKDHPTGFAANLLKGVYPSWLKPIESDGILKVWRVVDPMMTGEVDTVITGSTRSHMPRINELRGPL